MWYMIFSCLSLVHPVASVGYKWVWGLIHSHIAGARCVATLLHEMKRRGKDCRFGVVSMCIGLSRLPSGKTTFSNNGK